MFCLEDWSCWEFLMDVRIVHYQWLDKYNTFNGIGWKNNFLALGKYFKNYKFILQISYQSKFISLDRSRSHKKTTNVHFVPQTFYWFDGKFCPSHYHQESYRFQMMFVDARKWKIWSETDYIDLNWSSTCTHRRLFVF